MLRQQEVAVIQAASQDLLTAIRVDNRGIPETLRVEIQDVNGHIQALDGGNGYPLNSSGP